MKINLSYILFLIVPVMVSLTSCKAYKQDILFQLDENFTSDDLTGPVKTAEQNYRLQVNDQVGIEVFTNNGERIVDPNFELSQDMSTQAMQTRNQHKYLIQQDGQVKLPVIGKKKLSGLSIDEAEAVLEKNYDEFYKDSFVKLKILSRRVIVLGANGGQVVALENENMSLIEVLSLYGGLNLGAKAHNVKLIRGNLNDPEVYLINLSSIDGMKKSIIEVEAGDIIYVEPWRRPFYESLRDLAPVLSLASSVLTLIIVVQNLAQ